MSLIQKAVQRTGGRYVTGALPNLGEELGLHSGEDPRPVGSDHAATAALQESRRCFRLDPARLARQGLITPGSLRSPVAREVSAVKRRLLRRIGFFHRGGDRAGAPPRNVILVTSANAGEGKTFISANLALSLTLEEKLGVLLVDADLAASRLSEVFGLGAEEGLSDRLRGSVRELDAVLHREEGIPLSVLPSGPRSGARTELLAAPAMPALLREATARFGGGLVVMDGPPVLATSETPILAQHAAQVVLVVAAGRSTPEDVASALELLGCDDKVSLLLNRNIIHQRLPQANVSYAE